MGSTRDKDLEKLNRGKVGICLLMVFLAYLHVLLNIDYRGLKGFLRASLISFDVSDHHLQTSKQSRYRKRPYKDKEVVVYLDSSGAKVTNRGEWMR